MIQNWCHAPSAPLPSLSGRGRIGGPPGAGAGMPEPNPWRATWPIRSTIRGDARAWSSGWTPRTPGNSPHFYRNRKSGNTSGDNGLVTASSPVSWVLDDSFREDAVTSKALATALVACALGAAACGATANGASVGSAQDGGPVSPAQDTAADFASPAKRRGRLRARQSPAAGKDIQAKALSGKVVVIDPGHNGRQLPAHRGDQQAGQRADPVEGLRHHRHLHQRRLQRGGLHLGRLPAPGQDPQEPGRDGEADPGRATRASARASPSGRRSATRPRPTRRSRSTPTGRPPPTTAST